MRLEEIARRTGEAREAGAEVVCVLGLGFVGTAVVANLSRTRRGDRRAFFVIGLERDEPPGREKAASLEAGRPPTYANDPSLERVVAEACAEPRNLVGSVDPRVLELADVVVSCINLDLVREPGQVERMSVEPEGYVQAMRTVGQNVRPGTLVCVESTLPLGLCDRVLYPALCEGQRRRGVDVEADPPRLAYCYERVMPGPDYLDSVNSFWRAYAGIDEASADAAEAFLSKYVDVERFPLWRHKSIRAAEMAKLLENSYRATNIAFIEEWARLAEGSGVDLFDVIRSIKVRRGTHDNMMFPGLGVGGYCLTKDALLAAWGAENLIGADGSLPFSRRAILTNERMPLRALELVRRHFGGELSGLRAALFGVTYRPGVADTRSSATETLARALRAEGVEVAAYDPLVERWEELSEVAVLPDPAAALEGARIAVVCLPDTHYREFLAEVLTEGLQSGGLVIDPWDMVGTETAAQLARRGVAVQVFGRGDVPQPEEGR